MKSRRRRMLALVTSLALVATAMPGGPTTMTTNADTLSQDSQTDLSYEGYSLKWQDEFEGDSLDRSAWNVETHEPGWVNSELQQYVDGTDNISVHDGALYITAEKTVAVDGTVSYTSGRINTQNKEDFTYGLFEVRAKVPEGMGYLPAFWLMSSDENVYGQWPRCGEIDAMEVMGQDTSTLYGTIHYGNPHRESQGTASPADGTTFASDYHTFACEWEPGKITWYVDGVKYHEESDWYSTTVGQGTIAYPAPFDQPFYMILNLAVGGSWVGNPDESTSFDNNPYVIDYVRVYQKDSYDENVSRPEKTVDLRDPDASGNYIVNGDFDTDADQWTFLTALGGEASASVSNGQMNIETTADGSVDYSVQLVQAKLPFEKGATYQVSFDAYADEARTMKTAVKAPDYGYAEYMPSTEVDLTTDKKTYTYTFVMKDDSDANGRLEFNMGASGSTAGIHLDNVKVVKTAEADPNAVEEKTILADGNHVYNGKFQEGTNHLGYWTVNNTIDAEALVTSFTDGRRFKVTSTDSSNLDAVTLSQEGLALKDGNAYAFSFTGQADADCQIKATVGGKDFTVDLTKEKKTYAFVIPASEVLTDKNISFALAAGTTVYLDDVTIVENALIKNGSFNAGTSGYEIYIDGSASASYVVDSLTEDNALDVTVKDTGDQDWKVQVKQNNVPLEKGKYYTLSFEAKCDIDRNIRVIMQGNEAHGWPVYSGDNIVSLTSQYQTFTNTFQMTADTDEEAFLSICLGKINDRITTSHRVVIDNISLVEAEAPKKDEIEANVNLLQNADFSDEADAMAHWTETIANWGSDGATASATRSIENNAITYDIADAGNADWHVQLKQSGLTLEAGETYRVSFDITSSVARSFKTGVMSPTYTWYGGTDTAIEAGKQTITYEFTMNNDDVADFYVSLGRFDADSDTPAGVITLSNLSVIKVGDEVEPAPEPHVHTAGEVVIENKVEATYDSEGSYDEVVYCTDENCREEISRKTVTTPKLERPVSPIVKVIRTVTSKIKTVITKISNIFKKIFG